MTAVSQTAAAALYLTAERALRERRRFGRPTVRHFAIDIVRGELDGAVRVGALTAAQADAGARRAVLAAETEPVRVEAERQGVFEHLRAGRRVTRHLDEDGEWTLEATGSHRGAMPAGIVNVELTTAGDSGHEAAGDTPSGAIGGSGR